MSSNQSSTLFENELKDIYDAEQQIEKALEQMASDVEREEARTAFEEHREQTRGQIDRLEQVFDKLGMEPEAEDCLAIQGIVEEHRRFTEENPSQDEHDAFDLVAGQKVEHYEIAAYGNLANMADHLGMDEVGDLLHQNLEEEKETLTRLTELSDSVDYESLAA